MCCRVQHHKQHHIIRNKQEGLRSRQIMNGAVPAFFIIIIISMTFNFATANSEYQVTIPKGAGNPSFDPQFKKDMFLDQWYLPTKLAISTNDTVTWTNLDQEKHSVTSGQSSGREGVTGKSGIP